MSGARQSGQGTVRAAAGGALCWRERLKDRVRLAWGDANLPVPASMPGFEACARRLGGHHVRSQHRGHACKPLHFCRHPADAAGAPCLQASAGCHLGGYPRQRHARSRARTCYANSRGSCMGWGPKLKVADIVWGSHQTLQHASLCGSMPTHIRTCSLNPKCVCALLLAGAVHLPRGRGCDHPHRQRVPGVRAEEDQRALVRKARRAPAQCGNRAGRQGKPTGGPVRPGLAANAKPTCPVLPYPSQTRSLLRSTSAMTTPASASSRTTRPARSGSARWARHSAGRACLGFGSPSPLGKHAKAAHSQL